MVRLNNERSRNILLELKSNYGYEFEFKTYQIFPDPNENTWIRFRTRYYIGTKGLIKTKVKQIENSKAAKKGVSLFEYKDLFGKSVLMLRFDVPTFDSGDREYDSKHTLYLMHDPFIVSALFCKEGYRIAELYKLNDLSAVSAELLEYMKDAGFPVNQIRAI